MDSMTIQMPDMSRYMQLTQVQQVNADISVTLVFKSMFRSDNVLLDIYLNNISEESKIVSSKVLIKDSLVCQPNRDVGFSYYVNCIDQDGINEEITPNNLNKFYLYFTSYDSGRITA